MIKLLNKKIVLLIVGIVLASLSLSGMVFATVPATFSTGSQEDAKINVRNKLMYDIIAECYKSLSKEIDVTSGYVEWSEIFSNGNAKYNLPYYMFESSAIRARKKMSCSDIMGGWKNFLGTQIFPGIGFREGDVPVPDDHGDFGSQKEMIEFLEKIGYTPSEEGNRDKDGYRCVWYRGRTQGGEQDYATDKLCGKQSAENADLIDLNYALKVDDTSSDDLGGGNLDTKIFKVKSIEYSDGILIIPKVGYDTWVFSTGAIHAGSNDYSACDKVYIEGLYWSNNIEWWWSCYNYGFLNLKRNRFGVNGITQMEYNDLGNALGAAILTAKSAEPNNFPPSGDMISGSSAFIVDDALKTKLERGSFDDYMRYFLGDDYQKLDKPLTDTEKYILYWLGLKSVVAENSGAPNGNVDYWLVGTTFAKDYNLTCSSDCDIVTIDKNGKMKPLKAINTGNKYDTSTVLGLLNSLDYESEEFGEVESPTEDVYGENVSQDQLEELNELNSKCSEGGGALGWILCSALDLMSKASTGMYNNYIKPALNIEPKLFVSDGGTSNTWIAWQTFQGFANILFIILLLVVIFSQLTGVGIDNYGIKKILPKLIIGAVLVNLSYFICEICVDISNIVGNGIQALFSGLSQASEFTVEGATVSAAPGNTLVAVGVLGAAVGVAAIVANPAMLLSLFVSAIGIMISIFFIFILLSAREAAVVVLIVLSPLAFACYMLPNTKKLFDRWIKIWKGLLLVYPICGLLVGGGDYVSRLLMTIGSGSFFMAFTAMIAGVVPIFFLPTILKSSFVALGNLGSRISGIGQRLGNKAMSGARGSEAYKNASRMGLERRTRIKAGLDKNGNLTKRGEIMAKGAKSGLGRLVGADKRRANYIAAAKKDIAGSVAAGSTLTSTLARTGISQTDEALVLNDGNGGTEELFGARTEGAYYGNQFIEAAKKGNQRGMNAAIESMKKSGMKTKDIAKLLRFAQNGGYLDGMSDVDKAAWMRDMFQQHGDVLATDFELRHFMRSGGSANGGRLGNYGDYAMTAPIKMDEVVPEDFLRLSGDSIAGLAKAGILDQTMAQRIMAMNPNISADKKIMIGAIASGQIWGGIERNSDGYAIKSDGTVAKSVDDIQFVSGATVKDASTFKKDAETLSRNHNAGGSTSIMQGVNGSMVEAWASATPQAVNVVQNFTAGGGQYNPVEVTPWGGGGGGAGRAGGAGGTSGGGAGRAGGTSDTSGGGGAGAAGGDGVAGTARTRELAGRPGEIRPVEVPDHTADAALRGRTTTGGLRMEEGDSFEELGPIDTNNIQPIETPETPTQQSNVAQQRLDSMRQNLSGSNNSTTQPVSTRQAAPVVTPESAAATNVSQQRLNDMRKNLSRPSSSNAQPESAPRESAPRPASTGFDTNITPAERSILGSEREMRGATQDTVRRVESQIRAQAPASAPAPALVQAQAPASAPAQAQASASAPAQAPAAPVRAQAQVAPTQAPVAPVQAQAPASAPAQAPAAPARAQAQVAPVRAQTQVAPARASVTSAQSSTLASAQAPAPAPAPAQNSPIITGPNLETLARDAKRQFDARQSSNRNWSGNSVIKTK